MLEGEIGVEGARARDVHRDLCLSAAGIAGCCRHDDLPDARPARRRTAGDAGTEGVRGIGRPGGRTGGGFGGARELARYANAAGAGNVGPCLSTKAEQEYR